MGKRKKVETFQCYMCKGVFEKDPPGRAEKELEENFPGFSVDECEVVCDDCYKMFLREK